MEKHTIYSNLWVNTKVYNIYVQIVSSYIMSDLLEFAYITPIYMYTGFQWTNSLYLIYRGTVLFDLYILILQGQVNIVWIIYSSMYIVFISPIEEPFTHNLYFSGHQYDDTPVNENPMRGAPEHILYPGM